MTRFEDLLCTGDERRAPLRQTTGIYGIDFLEIRTEPPADNQRVLELHFQSKAADPGFNAFLTSLDGHPERFILSGGVRVQNIRVDTATRNGDVLELRVTESGDFSDYRLRIDHPSMDPVFAEVVFSFKAGCPSQFDCKPVSTCARELPANPAIDYLAKDYASFRQALLDRIALTNPDWRERRAADFGIAMAELFAYAADHLSYYQDAVANEAYLETANQRISIRRHVRLIDYEMHDGASSRAFVTFDVSKAGEIPAGTQILTKLLAPLKGTAAPSVIPAADAEEAVVMAAAVFEVEETIFADPSLTGIPIYTWGREGCCLPKGCTTAHLLGQRPLRAGDFLLLEEVKGPTTGLPHDADPTHRQVVRLTEVSAQIDPLDGTLLTRIAWDPADALTNPLCLSVTLNGTLMPGVSLACGNVGLAHHGRRVDTQITGVVSNFVLDAFPVSHWQSSAGGAPVSALLDADPRNASPAVAIENWIQADSLLDSDPDDAHFVTEIDNQGRAAIRVGDGVAGKRVRSQDILKVTYHLGLGPLFDVSGNSLVHMIDTGVVSNAAVVTSVRNPLPAWGGTAPEPLEDVKLTAPASLRTGLFRAVTESDYARAAEMMPEVSKAVATFRWTGSWHTVFVTVDPAGGADMTPELRSRVEAWVRRFLQTGYDLEINSPVYVPLEIEAVICTDSEHFRTDVYQSLLRALGRTGFFDPDRHTFGQPLYLSQLYAEISRVDGVRSATITRFQRFGKASQGELDAGVIRTGSTEVIRCDNDPNFSERGVLKLQMEGGK